MGNGPKVGFFTFEHFGVLKHEHIINLLSFLNKDPDFYLAYVASN
jgi:hypothetical protein